MSFYTLKKKKMAVELSMLIFSKFGLFEKEIANGTNIIVACNKRNELVHLK